MSEILWGNKRMDELKRNLPPDVVKQIMEQIEQEEESLTVEDLKNELAKGYPLHSYSSQYIKKFRDAGLIE